MTEQICLNCQWFCPKPCTDREMVEIYGILGECRLKHPDRGWPNTWASYWCGEWFERKRAPVFDPTPKYFIDDYEQRKKHAQSKDVES